jgi:hypothetical protein
MASTRGRLLVLGGNLLHGSDAQDSRMGACLWDLSLGQHTGDRKIDGETFLGRTWMFFSRGGGGGEEELQGTTDETFSHDDTSSKQPCLCYILYIAQWVFRCSMSSDHHEGGPRSSIALGRHVRCSVSTTRRPSPHIEDGEGAVAPRSGTDSTEQWVSCLCTCGLCCYVYMSITCICLLYVVICYMSVICYVSVICLW